MLFTCKPMYHAVGLWYYLCLHVSSVRAGDLFICFQKHLNLKLAYCTSIPDFPRVLGF